MVTKVIQNTGRRVYPGDLIKLLGSDKGRAVSQKDFPDELYVYWGHDKKSGAEAFHAYVLNNPKKFARALTGAKKYEMFVVGAAYEGGLS